MPNKKFAMLLWVRFFGKKLATNVVTGISANSTTLLKVRFFGNDFAKYKSATYFMPVWTLEEVQENNALLEANMQWQ
jgi:hypothetical protein